MASANWQEATKLQLMLPHTYTAMEHLIMAMADAFNNRGKTTFFGVDKGLKSYLKFEEKYRNALLAMTMDGLVQRGDNAGQFRNAIIHVLNAWQEIFPNWPDAHGFAYEKIIANELEAKKLISLLIGVQS
jgi:hypothetical protein